MVEYALLLVLILLATFIALQLVGVATGNSLNSSGSSIFPP